MAFEIQEAEKFVSDLEEAAFWLYTHNLEQSHEFADLKFSELDDEINDLKRHLRNTPRMGQADEITGLRRFPVYEGRYSVTWMINDKAKMVTLLEFIDSKNPQRLRQYLFDE
jgi:hypothetical protein